MPAMTPIVIRAPQEALGWNRPMTHGFALGTLPGGGYGIVWSDGIGLGSTSFGLRWESPFDPVRLEYRGQTYIFCREDSKDDALRYLNVSHFEQWYEGR